MEAKEDSNRHYVSYGYEEWGRGYIGVRTAPKDLTPSEDIEYKGSYKKDGMFDPPNKIILETFETHAEANQTEKYLHNYHEVHINPDFANKAKVTSTRFSRAGVKVSEEHKQKLSEAFKGKKHTEESKLKIGEASRGRKPNEETKQKIGEASKGNKNFLGKKHTEESKQKISEAQKGNRNFLGRTITEETKQKLSEARKGKKFYNNGVINKLFRDEIPEGFVKGRLSKK